MNLTKISTGFKFTGLLLIICCWLALYFYNFHMQPILYTGIGLVFVGILTEPRSGK